MKKPYSVGLRKVLMSPIANRDNQHIRYWVNRSQRVWPRTLQVDASSFGSGDGLRVDSVGRMCTGGLCPDSMALIPCSGCELGPSRVRRTDEEDAPRIQAKGLAQPTECRPP